MSAAAKLYAFIAAVVVAAAVYAGWRAEERRIGARDEKLAGLEVRVKNLAELAATVDTQIVRDTIRFKGALANYDSAKATVAPMLLHDSIPVPVEVVKTIIRDADATILACRVTVSDCMKEVGIQKGIVANRDTVISILKAQKPSILSRCGLNAGYGLTLAAGKLETGPSVSVGCRIVP